MPNYNRKRAGAKLPLILLSTFILLLLLASPAVAATPGDVSEDGNINVQDVVLVMQHILGIADPELTESQKRAADVNGDDAIDVQDATLIMQFVLGLIDEFPVEDPADVEVVSVEAINRTTILVELVENVDEDLAADEDEYEVTVDGDAVEVEEVDYDADENEATLTVDLEGLSGVLKVNGVEAEDEVPAIPEFTGMSAIEGSRDITLEFNVPVYERLSLRPALDFEVSVAGTSRSITNIDAPDSADDAEDEFTITVEAAGRPAAFDSVVVTIKASGADRIANVWGETMEELAVRSTTAQRDDDPPTFDGITVYDNSTFVIAHFSEPVNTSNYDIEVGSGLTQVRVTGEKPDGTPLSFTGDGIVRLDQDEEERNLRIELASPVPAGSIIDVRFGVTAGSRIEDRAGNSLAGVYSRSTTALPGPTLKDVEVSNLSAGTDDQTQEFKFTLVGDMDRDEEIVIDLTEATAIGIDYSTLNTRYNVSGASGSVTGDGDSITFSPTLDLSDGTALTITADEVDTTGVGSEEDIEVMFERSEVGATVTAEFDVLSGLSNISIEAEYERLDDPTNAAITSTVEVLASGRDEHTVTFEFTLTEEMADGDSVDIDLSDLIAAGVSFGTDDPGVTVTGLNSADAAMSASSIIVTADGPISTNAVVTVTAADVDVDVGSAAEDVEVYFTRSDSGLTFTSDIDIVPGFVGMEVTNIDSEPNQTVFLTFVLDGARAIGGTTARIALDSSFGFADAEADVVLGAGSASISTTTGIVTYTAPLGGLSDGTEIAIEVTGIDASTVSDALVVFERRPGGFEAAVVMEID